MFPFLLLANQTKHTSGYGASAHPITTAFPSHEDLPPSARGYHTNNKYDGFPPIMSDSRALFASWQPEAIANEELINKSGVQSNWEYRQYLTNNAESIMKHNFAESANDIGHYSNVDSSDQSYSTPHVFSGQDDDSRPYGMDGDSDLKNIYLSREYMQSRRVAVAMTQEELLNALYIEKTVVKSAPR